MFLVGSFVSLAPSIVTFISPRSLHPCPSGPFLPVSLVSSTGPACHTQMVGGRGFSLPLRPSLSPLAEKDWTEEDKSREKVLMQELMTLIEQRNAIVNCLDEDRQR